MSSFNVAIRCGSPTFSLREAGIYSEWPKIIYFVLIIVAFLQNATIDFECVCTCTCMCGCKCVHVSVFVCVCFCTTTQKEINLGT